MLDEWSFAKVFISQSCADSAGSILLRKMWPTFCEIQKKKKKIYALMDFYFVGLLDQCPENVETLCTKHIGSHFAAKQIAWAEDILQACCKMLWSTTKGHETEQLISFRIGKNVWLNGNINKVQYSFKSDMHTRSSYAVIYLLFVSIQHERNLTCMIRYKSSVYRIISCAELMIVQRAYFI